MPEITTFFMFNDQAEQAAQLYTSVFPNSRIIEINRTDEGAVTGAEFELDGQRFACYNGGPYFSFSEGLSLMVHCDSQEEVDHYWYALSKDGEESQCGWLKDPFGVSWQIVPKALLEMIGDSDREKAGRAVQAMLKMHKLEIDVLRKAFEGTE